MKHGWKDIKSAPEGEYFLVISDRTWGHGFTIPNVARRISNLPDGSGEIIERLDGSQIKDATLWHPLPEVPVKA